MSSDKRRKSRVRGFQKERELVRKLWEEGFACMRAPASGAKVRKSVQPDIIAARNNLIFVMEVKTRRSDKAIYIEKEKIDKLAEWANRAGTNALPLIAVYTSREHGWRFVPINKLECTEGGYYKVKIEDISRFYDINTLKAISDKSLKIEKYL